MTAALLVFGHGAAPAAEPKPNPHRTSAHRVTAPHAPATDAATDPVEVASAPATGGISDTVWQQSGMATYYGPRHHGRMTASGTRFDQEAMTAAHASLPFGTRVRVVQAATGREVVVVITDRIGAHRAIIDLSVGAARELGILRQGMAMVTLSAE